VGAAGPGEAGRGAGVAAVRGATEATALATDASGLGVPGATVGAAVGTAVGRRVSARVGAAVGAIVGTKVGRVV
jgi:hypothetical protein